MRLRVVHGRRPPPRVDIVLPDGTAQRVVTEIAVQDLLIAGLGDSIAAGEGNPDRPVRLSDGGFCFRRFLASRPANITGRAAPASPATAPARPADRTRTPTPGRAIARAG